jgi:hypothetical protein
MTRSYWRWRSQRAAQLGLALTDQAQFFPVAVYGVQLADGRMQAEHFLRIAIDQRIDFQLGACCLRTLNTGDVSSTSPWWRSLMTKTRRTWFRSMESFSR